MPSPEFLDALSERPGSGINSFDVLAFVGGADIHDEELTDEDFVGAISIGFQTLSKSLDSVFEDESSYSEFKRRYVIKDRSLKAFLSRALGNVSRALGGGGDKDLDPQFIRMKLEAILNGEEILDPEQLSSGQNIRMTGKIRLNEKY